jgi:rhodanese-related sulfurtransferase
MKELEKTKRISFSAVIIILVVLIGIWSFQKPNYVFKKNKELTLKPIISQDYIIPFKDLDSSSIKKMTFIDVRNAFDYNEGHLKNAKNIYTADLLDEKNKEYLNGLEEQNKTIVLYASTPGEASGAWMLLTQLGIKNVKLLSIKTNHVNNTFSISDFPIEKAQLDYAAYMKKATSGKIEVKKVTRKRVIKLTKKKKKVAEGGC